VISAGVRLLPGSGCWQDSQGYERNRAVVGISPSECREEKFGKTAQTQDFPGGLKENCAAMAAVKDLPYDVQRTRQTAGVVAAFSF
jgi:hypothetical protein